MQVLRRLVFFTIHASLFILVLPLVSSSQDHSKTTSHASKKDNNHKLSSKLMFEITLHGFLLWASMGFLMPVGILVIRMSNRILAVLIATAGAVMSIKNFNNSFNNYHQRIGVALYGIIWLQALVGFIRPRRGSKGRSVWFFMHWLLGTAVCLLGVLNIYTGLQAYHEKTSRGIRFWTIIFTAEMSFLAFFYLFQDKWLHIQRQGVVLGNEPIMPNDQEISPRDKQKELKILTC
ncbi:cytochrome b561 domain-containing protein [Quercus suber]|uniref:Cytochrome b561 domain-containing protein n=1 Tax=Quercus suber TaxID=58331 RepID=A0AAW0KCY8_QUESU